MAQQLEDEENIRLRQRTRCNHGRRHEILAVLLKKFPGAEVIHSPADYFRRIAKAFIAEEITALASKNPKQAFSIIFKKLSQDILKKNLKEETEYDKLLETIKKNKLLEIKSFFAKKLKQFYIDVEQRPVAKKFFNDTLLCFIYLSFPNEFPNFKGGLSDSPVRIIGNIFRRYADTTGKQSKQFDKTSQKYWAAVERLYKKLSACTNLKEVSGLKSELSNLQRLDEVSRKIPEHSHIESKKVVKLRKRIKKQLLEAFDTICPLKSKHSNINIYQDIEKFWKALAQYKTSGAMILCKTFLCFGIRKSSMV